MDTLLLFILGIALLVLLLVALSRLGSMERKVDRLQFDLREALYALKSTRLPVPSSEAIVAPVPAAIPERPVEVVPEAVSEGGDPAEETVPVEAVALTEFETEPVVDDTSDAPYRGAAPPPLPQGETPSWRAALRQGNTAGPQRAAVPEPAATPVAAKVEPGRFESSVREILAKIWNWIVVGEEHRPKGVTMEFAVATTWLVRIGVLIFVIGIGFFLKYAVTKGWIGPMGRVLLATLTGTGLVAGGLRLFSGRFRVLGQGLAGAGFATLYFSFFTAHQPGYDIIGPVAAFAMMVLVTAAAGLVAVRFNSLLVAVLGLLGGYGTPLMIQSGNDNVVLLFGYILLLGIGVIFIASRRNWRLLHYLSFLATCVLVWMTFDRSFAPGRFWEFMPFLLAFFALFSSVTFVYQLLHRRSSTLLELLFLFLNAAAFAGFSVNCIEATYRREAIAVLTLGLAIFYILHVAFFLKRDLRDRGLLLSFLGLASFFVAITLPIVLSKGWITVSWSLQAFVMLWIASKMRSEFLRQLAYLLYLIVLARFAIFDLEGQFGGLTLDLPAKDYAMRLVERLFIFGVPIGSFFAAGRLFRHEGNASANWQVGEGNDIKPIPGQSGIGRICFWIVVGLTFVYLNLEVSYNARTFFDPFVRPGLTLVWVGLGALLLREMLVNRSSLATVLFWILGAALVLKVFLFDFIHWKPGFNLAFAPRDFASGFLMRLIDYGAVIVYFLFAARLLSGKSSHEDSARIFGYGALAAVFIYTSLEIWTGLHRFLPAFRMGGLSIYWSIFAITLLLAGIQRNRPVLRGIGLCLLGATILKVFFLDLAGLDQLYRIISFIGLGILVLLGSYLYFKYSHRFATASEAEEESPAQSKSEDA